MKKKHRFRFFRAGGVDQVILSKGEDIAHLEELDLKLWMVVAMPTRGVALAEETAAILDEDGDLRVRVSDLLRAIAWLRERLTSLDGLFAQEAKLDISTIADPRLKTVAAWIAGGERGEVTLEQVRSAEERFSSERFNGDGVITPKSAERGELAALIEAIIAARGGVDDRSGEAGIDADAVSAYFEDAEKLLAWRVAGEDASVTRPLGEATEAGAALLRDLGPKLDDYFARVKMAAFDDRAVAASHGTDAELTALGEKALALDAPELLRLPIARIAPGEPIGFEARVNPAYQAQLTALRDAVVAPLLGAPARTLDEAGLSELRQRFASFEAWYSSRPEVKIADLSAEALRELLGGSSRRDLEALIESDLARKEEFEEIYAVEKLVVLHRDLLGILRSFVNFADFYSRKLAIFQAGRLYLDSRACDLCVEVEDAGAHVKLATLAGGYLAYCDLRRKDAEPRKIVAVFTAGDGDNLMVGRNGIFLDREGNFWDATITLVVENPISIGQAFFAPYKRFVRLIEEQVSKRAANADQAAQARIESAAEKTANADQAAPSEGPSKIDVGTVAALGVAVGGIGAMVTGLVSTFLGLGWFMPFGILALILAISLPSVVLAVVKLRRRNLGPLLDASGWAVNGLAVINVPFGKILTQVAELPDGAERLLHDPYAPRKRPIKLMVFLLLVLTAAIGWATGRLDRYLPEGVRSTVIFPIAPAAPEASEGAGEETVEGEGE